jgi:hypothetical protein
MKITKEHYSKLESIIKEIIDNSGGINFVVEQYETGKFARSEKVKDLQTRFVWDVYSTSKDWDFKNALYDYLNDSHIETALKRILPKVTRKY